VFDDFVVFLVVVVWVFAQFGGDLGVYSVEVCLVCL